MTLIVNHSRNQFYTSESQPSLTTHSYGALENISESQ